MAFDKYCCLDEELEGAVELFQEAGDNAEMREMARAEMKEIEAQLEEMDNKIKVLLLPKDPNNDRNCMLGIRAETGGSEANIFAGECYFTFDAWVEFCMMFMRSPLPTFESHPGHTKYTIITQKRGSL